MPGSTKKAPKVTLKIEARRRSSNAQVDSWNRFWSKILSQAKSGVNKSR